MVWMILLIAASDHGRRLGGVLGWLELLLDTLLFTF